MKKLFSDLIVLNNNNLANNTYVLINNNQCVIIDPSTYENELKSLIDENKYQCVGILLTHGHFDHIMCAFNLANYFGIKIYASANEKEVINKYSCAKELFGINAKIYEEYVTYFNGNNLEVKNFKFNILHTPGHTVGGVIYIYHNYVFSGDTVFIYDVGRWDLPTGDPRELIKSLKLIKSAVHDDQYILCGHDDKYVKFKEVKQLNRYLKQV